MLQAVGDVLTAFIGWVGEIVSSLLQAGGEGAAAGALNPLLPLFAIGIAVSVFMVAFKAIRKVTWGA